MSNEAPPLGEFKQWTAHQFGAYLRDKCGLGAYYEAVISNDISGDTAPRLTEADLKVRRRRRASNDENVVF